VPLAGVTTIVLGLVAALVLASCVAVIAVQLWQTSTAMAQIDAGLAQLPPALDGLEPAMDTVNESLTRVVAAASESISVT
jgi:hypothetical protein